jgi:tRNA(fMet)-specific endonuclease VapC
MLDTNVVSQLMRDPAGPVTRRIAMLSEPVSVSIVVAAELRYGAARKRSSRLTATLERVLNAIEIEALAAPVDVVYGALRDRLERDGRPLAANDLLIAAHALVLERILVTAEAAFARVPGLSVENWLE